MIGRMLFHCLLTAGGVLALSACGGSDGSSANTSGAASSAVQATTAAAFLTATVAAPAPSSAATGTPVTSGAAAGIAAPAGGSASTSAIMVKAGETGAQFYFDPPEVTAKAGKITVTVNNVGTRSHTWNVKNKTGNGDIVQTDEIDASGTKTVEFTITEPGQYEILCELPGHASRGQRGTLTVTT